MIPAITHELGRYWEAPKREAILVDETHAMMSSEDYGKLLNYETSIPSGVYDGKMWRCFNTLCWYGQGATPEVCSINRREIIIV